MELTLNELKIFKNALNTKLRTVCLESSEFININKSLSKVNTEIKRIDNEMRQKSRDESLKAISQFLKPKKDKMKILVAYRPKKEMEVQRIVLKLPSDIIIHSDQCKDYCADKITENLGYHPRWIRVEGTVTVY